MTLQFLSLEKWMAECRQVVRRDLDNLLLFTGEEGSGKSTLQLMILRALDPKGFDLNRVRFTAEEFLDLAPTVPKFGAVAADEILLNRRKSMTKTNIRFLEFLQVCRGLNLHMGLCFPHDVMLDRGVVDHRVRYNLHIPSRGEFIIRVRKSVPDKWRPDEVRYVWVPVGHFKIPKETFERFSKSAFWLEYTNAKERHMRGLAGIVDAERAEEKESDDFFESWLREVEEKKRSKWDIPTS